MTFEVHEKAKASFGKEMCKIVISENVAVAESPQYKKDVFRHSGSSAGAQDYDELLKELLDAGLVNQD